MIRGENRIDLSPEKSEKTVNIQPMPRGRERREIFLRQSEQTHRRVHPPPILPAWVATVAIFGSSSCFAI
jgi:hypothetical protein